jgi:hypothetical protein
MKGSASACSSSPGGEDNSDGNTAAPEWSTK